MGVTHVFSSDKMPERLPYNFSWILKNRLAGTNCPSSLELTALEKQGISLLVTLSPDKRPNSASSKLRIVEFFIKEFSGASVNLLSDAVDIIAKVSRSAQELDCIVLSGDLCSITLLYCIVRRSLLYNMTVLYCQEISAL